MDFLEIYFRKRRRQLESLSSVKVLFSCLALALIVMGALLFWAHSILHVAEKPPVMQPLPAVDGRIPAGFYVSAIDPFDPFKRDFTLQGTLWFLTDKPAEVAQKLALLEFTLGQILNQSPPRQRAVGDQTLLAYDLTLRVSQTFDFRYFPFDSHRLYIPLVNKDPTLKLDFSETAFQLAPLEMGNWKYGNERAAMGLIQEEMGPGWGAAYEQALFSFDCQRASIKDVLVVLIPLLLIFLIGSLSLTFDALKDTGIVVYLAIGAITGLFLFISFLPKTSSFTVVDRIYVVLLLMLMAIVGTQLYLIHNYNRLTQATKLPDILSYKATTLNIFRGILFLVFLVIMVGSLFWTLPLR